MLEAKHHFFFYPFFQHYSSWKIGRNFHEVKVIGTFDDQQLPILLLANHVSWWDGFWIMNLDMKVLKRKFHFMMLEEQLQTKAGRTKDYKEGVDAFLNKRMPEFKGK